MLRKRIPERYRSVSGRAGDTIKFSTGTADRKQAERKLPELLMKWVDLQAEWDRKLSVVTLTPERAEEIAAGWAAWIAGGAVLETDGVPAKVFKQYVWGEATPEDHARRMARLEHHVEEALRLSDVAVTPETRPVLLHTMSNVVWMAYEQYDLAKQPGPLEIIRRHLPFVDAAPPPKAAAVPLDGLLDGWQAVASVKPRVVGETQYIVRMLRTFLRHDDAAQIGRDDLIRWRTATIAEGRSNDTWNNRLSMVRQVFARAVADGKLTADPTDGLRLPKGRASSWLPYSDGEAARILTAARVETRPSLRWAPWIMAFTGMRVAEVLQLTGGDVREEAGIHYVSVNEDEPGKSVKNSERRNVPLHSALLAEGFLTYAQTIAPTAPLFPDKALDRHGQRGGRGWNLVGKWVRKSVGIDDVRKAPNHSWRHRIEDELRVVECPEDVRDAILGHARKTTGRIYGVRGEALKRLHRYLSLVPVPPGIEAVRLPAA
jgi:integrase